MFTFCFFLSLSYSYCYEGRPAINHEIVVERSAEMIVRYEGFAPIAYRDTSGRFSIWFWTRSYEGETVTRNEAYARMQAITRQVAKKVVKDFPEANESEVVALVGLAYNCHGGYKKLKKYWVEYMKTPGFCTLPKHSWLLKRRAEERALFNF